MAFSYAQTRQALKASGAPFGSLLALVWPLGRQKRIRSLLRKRLAVLDTKNHVVEYLFRAQRALADLRISRKDQMEAALKDPRRRASIMPVAVSREMLEEFLGSRAGSERGRTLDQALAELEGEGAVLQVSVQMGVTKQNCYFAVHRGPRPHYDTSRIDRLLQQDRDLGSDLKARLQRDDATEVGRTYRL